MCRDTVGTLKPSATRDEACKVLSFSFLLTVYFWVAIAFIGKDSHCKFCLKCLQEIFKGLPDLRDACSFFYKILQYIPIFISSLALTTVCLKVYFVWYNCSYPWTIWVFIRIKYPFTFSLWVSLKLKLTSSAYMWVLFFFNSFTTLYVLELENLVHLQLK